MRSLSASAMREADRRAIEALGIPGAALMYNAGAAVYREARALGGADAPIAAVCGPGNNGGDGFVAALLALCAGGAPRVILLGPASRIAGDPAIFLGAYTKLGGGLIAAEDEAAVTAALSGIPANAVMVDAILGTGARGAPRGLAAAAIAAWPARPTVAVDVPSGLDADTGQPAGPCIRADVTVTMQFAKQGFLAPSAADYLGRLCVADIGIPEICADDEGWTALTGGQ